MSSEENKAIVRRFWEVSDGGDLDAAKELLAPDFTAYIPGNPPLDSEGMHRFGVMFYGAFPDLRHTAEDQVAEGEKVATRFTVRATHEGEFQGMPPTGNQVTVTGIVVDRFVDGKIAERRVIFDALGLMQQLGAIPAPEAAGA